MDLVEMGKVKMDLEMVRGRVYDYNSTLLSLKLALAQPLALA
jgi:hypothetical protein